MWRLLARFAVGLSMSVFGVMLIIGLLSIVGGVVVFYLFVTG